MAAEAPNCEGSWPVVSACSNLRTSSSVEAAAIAALIAVSCSGVGPLLGFASGCGAGPGKLASTCAGRRHEISNEKVHWSGIGRCQQTAG